VRDGLGSRPTSPTPGRKAAGATQAMVQMVRLDIAAELQRAFDGVAA